MRCTKYDGVVTLAENNKELHGLLDQVLDDIRTNFNKQVNQLPSEWFIRDHFYLSPEVRIVELKPFDFIKYFSPNSRGTYNVDSGKIFLHRGKWCRSTILHETLHSVSSLSLNLQENIDFAKKNKWIREGLTELFAGYLLYKKYTDCYEAWRTSLFQNCTITYPREVKFWSTFCQFVPITIPAKLYFWNPLQTLNDSYHHFIEAIRCKIPNFPDLLHSGNILKQTEFREVCMNHFGKNFCKIEKSRKKSLDFAKLCY